MSQVKNYCGNKLLIFRFLMTSGLKDMWLVPSMIGVGKTNVISLSHMHENQFVYQFHAEFQLHFNDISPFKPIEIKIDTMM